MHIFGVCLPLAFPQALLHFVSDLLTAHTFVHFHGREEFIFDVVACLPTHVTSASRSRICAERPRHRSAASKTGNATDGTPDR